MWSEQLREAATGGNTKEVVRLLAEGAKVTPDKNGRNALHLSTAGGHAEVTAALLLAGCDVNAADSAGCTALQVAAAEGHLEIVKQLIKHGADVNRQDTVHGNTAMHEASWKGYSQTVAALCKAKANMHIKNYGGFAALHLCCQNGHNQSCRELLIAGCNPDLQNNYGDTPLHTSARYGHAGVTRILISAHCHVSDQNKNGDTALHIAAAMGRRKLTRILLESSCNKYLRNKQHETAKDIAVRKDLTEILAILSSSSSKKHKKKDKTDGSKEAPTSQKKEKKKQKVQFTEATTVSMNKNWSPYGCHYYPDPKAFPSPKLDSLPPEPLKKGEQYFLDLAGNICKGPVGVGYTCYCAPFFRHMEEQLERDKQELQNKIDIAEQRLDKKVQNLERRTESRLSQLKLHQHHLAQWLRNEAGLHRTRSLDLLLDNELSVKLDSLNVDNNVAGNSDAQPHRSMDDLSHSEWQEQPVDVPKDPLGKFWRSQFLGTGRTKCPDLVSSLHSHNSQTSDPLEHSKQESVYKDRLSDNYALELPVKNDDRDNKRLSEWKRHELRRSVHEIVSRVQHSNPHRSNKPGVSCREEGEGREEEAEWCGVEGVGEHSSVWRRDISSDSSDGEDVDQVRTWQEVKRLPYRSRSAVYSPPLEREPNDSGYSTKICSNSQGPSPSLSGRLESDNNLLRPNHLGVYEINAKSVNEIIASDVLPTTQLTNECQNIYTGEASLV
ncbi:ankyrin repeat domain containing protein 6 diego [Lycorma delicatula]|uniref:ankyrin repeat domain containing protein 6 diego n=1 Tax=Lycorma delicatula TaxID=130591 RepID=UPI003F51A785